MSTIDRTVCDALRAALQEQGVASPRLTVGAALVDDLGFQSLTLATVIARLELELDVEPFVEDFAITDIRTVGDLCEAFRVTATGGE